MAFCNIILAVLVVVVAVVFALVVVMGLLFALDNGFSSTYAYVIGDMFNSSSNYWIDFADEKELGFSLYSLSCSIMSCCFSINNCCSVYMHEDTIYCWSPAFMGTILV